MEAEVVTGDLLEQDVEVIVNAWNRNLIPWWLLLPQGVSGAIKRRAGAEPFRELARAGSMRLGAAALTGAGRLPYRGIIHVAGINMLWRASEESIRRSVSSAMRIVADHGFKSIAFPVVGAGSGGLDAARALDIMVDALSTIDTPARVKVVRFQRCVRPIRTGAAAGAIGLAAGLLLQAACTDCFLAIHGRVVDCATMQPVTAATVSLHIDAGIHGAHDWPTTFTTDDSGGFRIETDGTETCDSPATLRFQKDGFVPLEVSVKGRQDDLEVCMSSTFASF